MAQWDDLFAEAQLHLLQFTIDPDIGELTAVPLDTTFARSKEALAHVTIKALIGVFKHFGIEVRDVIEERIPRAHPLNNLVKIQANLTTIDTMTTLGDTLTAKAIESLQATAGLVCTTTASATLERVYHPKHGIYANTVVILKPCENAAPFRVYEHGYGTCESPKPLPDGSYIFALGSPFGDGSELAASEEAELAAWNIGARLEEFTAPF